MDQKKIDPKGGNATVLSVSPLKALAIHLLCGVGLGLAFWVADHIYSVDLITHPSETLRLISVFVAPVLILLYSHLRHDRNQCSYFRAVGRGLLALPAGAVVNALGATILGAPVGFDLYQRLVFLVHHGLIGTEYLLEQRQMNPQTILSVYLLMELLLERGLVLGQCHLIGKAHGRNGLFV